MYEFAFWLEYYLSLSLTCWTQTIIVQLNYRKRDAHTLMKLMNRMTNKYNKAIA